MVEKEYVIQHDSTLRRKENAITNIKDTVIIQLWGRISRGY